jgi:dienelactone hydrolase
MAQTTPGVSPPNPNAGPCALSADGAQLNYGNGRAGLSSAIFQPQGPGPFPAILLLHPSVGLDQTMLDHGAWLASQGYVALAPDYFTPVGITDPEGTIGGKWDAILSNLLAAVDCLKSLPFVAGDQLAIVGFSIGAPTGFMVATQRDFKAIVTWYGSFYLPVPPNSARDLHVVLPRVNSAVLMLTGEADPRSTVANARSMQAVLNAGKPVGVVTYPSVGHNFDRPGPTYNAAALADARSQMLTFLVSVP